VSSTPAPTPPPLHTPTPLYTDTQHPTQHTYTHHTPSPTPPPLHTPTPLYTDTQHPLLHKHTQGSLASKLIWTRKESHYTKPGYSKFLLAISGLGSNLSRILISHFQKSKCSLYISFSCIRILKQKTKSRYSKLMELVPSRNSFVGCLIGAQTIYKILLEATVEKVVQLD
jgi:hypothetical protein